MQAAAQTQSDLRLYLQVARELLRPQSSSGLSSTVKSLVDQARAASGIASVSLFGVDRDLDFSQFTPRGHYTAGLENYFQAMIWLGQVDFRLLETQSDGSVVFRRAQYDATLAVQQAMQGRPTELWAHIDGAVHPATSFNRTAPVRPVTAAARGA
ncbi:MAG: DUF3160 domain-containing protein [Deltaproteobacteria bacterium]